MDFSVLLSNSDFDDNKLHLLETLTDIVYKTSNSNDRAFANQLLGDFKLLENSWQFCDKILMKSNNMYSKFFAVSILEDLVNTKFNLLANDQKEVIRNFIIDILIIVKFIFIFIFYFLKNKKVRVFRRLRTRVVQTLGLRC